MVKLPLSVQEREPVRAAGRQLHVQPKPFCRHKRELPPPAVEQAARLHGVNVHAEWYSYRAAAQRLYRFRAGYNAARQRLLHG